MLQICLNNKLRKIAKFVHTVFLLNLNYLAIK